MWEDLNQAVVNVVNNENRGKIINRAWQVNKYNIKKKKRNGLAGKGFQEERIILKTHRRD